MDCATFSFDQCELLDVRDQQISATWRCRRFRFDGCEDGPEIVDPNTEDELNAAIIEQQADNVLDQKKEVRKNLRQLFQVALDKCELEVALKAVVMMGSIDGCANFIHEKATRYETIININFVNGLQEMLRVPGMVDPQGIRELLLKCIDGDGAVSASDPTPRRIAIPGSPERELEVT